MQSAIDRPYHPRRSERRNGRSRFHLPERRTGFDRRRQYPLTGTLRDNPALILGVLVLINVLSALDFGLTYAELQAGVAAEGNPLLAGLFAAGPSQAWLFKGSVMLVVSLIIWHQRKHRAMLAVALARARALRHGPRLPPQRAVDVRQHLAERPDRPTRAAGSA